MAKTTNLSCVNVVIEDQNDSFVPYKNVRSVTAKWTPEENKIVLKTPAPGVPSEPVPPLYEVKDYKMQLNKLKKGIKLSWDVNIASAKIAGKELIMEKLEQCVDALFMEIKANNL